MHLKPLSGGMPAEEPDMRGQPPLTGTVALTFIPGELFVDRVQRPDPDLGGAPDRTGLVRAVKQDHVSPDDRRRLPSGPN